MHYLMNYMQEDNKGRVASYNLNLNVGEKASALSGF